MENSEQIPDAKKEYSEAYDQAKKQIYADSYNKSQENIKKTTHSVMMGCGLALAIIAIGLIANFLQ